MAPTELSEHQLRAIEITERVCSVASLLGTSFIIITFLTDKNFYRPINRLVFYASWGNILANVGTLISRSGIFTGVDGALCQFQAFLIQMFLPADALWTLCMAFNVYLTFFHKYDARQLRTLEWKYIVFCYGTPFIPAFVYFFISTEGKGKIYGSATLWCWVAVKWDILRVAVFYGPVWLVIVVTFGIYFWAGKEIFEKSRQLRDFSAYRAAPYPVVEDPFSTPTVSTKTTEIHVSSELAELPRRNSSQVSLKEAENRGRSKPSGYDQYSVTIETNPVAMPPQDWQPIPPRGAIRSEQVQKQRTAASEANKAAIGYCKTALLFFMALLITWVPSTINRVYSLAHPEAVSFGLNYASGFVLPLQGFWNAVVYSFTSRAACKLLYERLFSRTQPSVPISRARPFSVKSFAKDSLGDQSTDENCSESMKGLARG